MKPHEFCSPVLRILVVTLVGLLLCTETYSQKQTSISGTVSDERGSKIVGAEVRLISRTGAQHSSSTNDDGAFEFAQLSAGEYFLEVKASGFANFSSGVSLQNGDQLSFRVQMKVATVSESVVVTAAGTPQLSNEVSKVISVIDAQQIESRHSLFITENLRGLPGVRVQQQGSPGALTAIRLRGQRSFDTALLLDGLRIRDASDLNGSAASLFADLVPGSLDRIEILRGSGSSIYGTNAIGGVINLVPRVGSGSPRFQLGFEGGSLRTFGERFQGDGGGPRYGYSFALSRTDVRRGVDGNDEYGNSAGSAHVQFNPISSITISGNIYATFANARINDSPFALPEAFAGFERFPKAAQGVTFQPDFNNPDQGRRHRLVVESGRILQQLGEKFSYSVAYQRVSSNRRNYNGPQIDPAFESFYPFGDFEFLNVNKGITDTLDARVHAVLGRANLLTGGLEFERESLFQHSMPSFSAFNDTTDRQNTFAVFAQDELSLLDDRLQLSFGIRGQFFRVRTSDRPEFLNAINPQRAVTGDGSIAYFIRTSSTKLRAHVGNGFRSPSLFERFGSGTFAQAGLTRFGDPTLRAERSISVDGGVDQRFANDRLFLSVTYFYTRRQRVITFQTFVTDPLGLSRLGGYANEPGGLARGAETFFEATPFRGMAIRGSYTYTNSDRASASPGLLREYVIPSHLFGLSLNQRYKAFVFDFELNRTGSYIAPVFANSFPFAAAELTFPGYTKADLFGSYEKRISDRFSAVFFAGGENLFNEKYFENGFRVPGFMGRGGVSLKF